MKGKTVFITGGSRGIGKAIALRLAQQQANIVIAAKSVEEDPRLGGTIHSVAQEIEQAGGRALAIQTDIRFEEQVKHAVELAVSTFGGIDILINNASAIYLAGTEQTPMKRFDLMFNVNVRGTFLTSQACIPHLRKASNPHILNLSPPLNMDAKWFQHHVAYTMAKYGMSMCVLGMSDELKPDGIAVNALWPRTVIATAAVQNLLGGDEVVERSRKPEIVADAAYFILQRNSRTCTGNFFIDDDVLASEGITDLAPYSTHPHLTPLPDFFL
jgi:citronellol/citronellal dehydrogenase